MKKSLVSKLASAWSDVEGQMALMRHTNPAARMRRGLETLKELFEGGMTLAEFNSMAKRRPETYEPYRATFESWVKRGKTASGFELELPDVNLNGTGVDDLINQARGVVSAIHELQEALAKATPHGRDYFDQSRAMDARRSVESMAKTLSVWEREWRGVAVHLMDAKYKRQR